MNYPTTPGAFQDSNAADFNGNFFTGDAFMTRITADGSALTYSTFIGGSENEAGRGIALDRDGNASITGGTNSTDLPTTPGVVQPAYGGGDFDAFVVKLIPDGTGLVYATYLGGSLNFNGEDAGNDIASDRIGNVYVTGYTQSSNFPTTPGAFDTTFNGSTDDAFVTKIAPNGQTLIYSTYLGGTVGEVAYAIAVDRNGSAYVTGLTSSAGFPTTPGVFQPTFGGFTDVFVTKLLPSGRGLAYSSFLGTSGSNLEAGYAIAVDRSGNAYLTGETESNAFPTTPGAFDTTHNSGLKDVFVAKVVLT